MKWLNVFVLAVFIFTSVAHGFVQQNVTPKVQLEAARGIIQRTTPAVCDQFILQIIPQEKDGLDLFEIESHNGKIVLRGNNGVSLASAYNWYTVNP